MEAEFCGKYFPAGIYLFKVNNNNLIFIVNFVRIFTPCSSVFIVSLKEVITGWVCD